MAEKKLKSSNYYLAYLDILGTKDIVAKDKNDRYLNELNKIYEQAISTKLLVNDWNNLHINAKIFSDNILLFIKADGQNDRYKLESLIGLASMIQCAALAKGYLLRGGITYGNFFENERFVHGQALVHAVNLEEKNAIYPRIIIDDNCLNCFELITTRDQNCRNCKNTEKINDICIKYCNRKIIKQDVDEVYFANFYYHNIGIAIFENFKKQLLIYLRKNNKDLKVKQKIMWLINYHNDFCRKDLGIGRFAGNPIITEEEITNATK